MSQRHFKIESVEQLLIVSCFQCLSKGDSIRCEIHNSPPYLHFFFIQNHDIFYGGVYSRSNRFGGQRKLNEREIELSWQEK